MNNAVAFTDKETRREQLNATIDSLVERIADLTDDAKASETFKSWLVTTRTFHRYSWRNTWLIAMQSPNCSRVAGMKAWNKLGYRVKKGSKAVWILAPMVVTDKKLLEKTGEEKKRCIGFRDVPVYANVDVEPIGSTATNLTLPDECRGDGDALFGKLLDFAAAKGIQVQQNCDLGSAKGCASQGLIRLAGDRTSTQTAETLAHELGHHLCGHLDGIRNGDHTRSVAEIEAEAVAATVMGYFGVETDSHFYLAAWGGDKKAVSDSLDRIRKVIAEIIEAVEGSVAETEAEAA